MNMPLVFEPEVANDVDRAYAWYEHERPGLGEELLAEVQTALDQIQESPQLHAVVYRDVRRALVRRFPYAVYYRIEPKRLAVIALYHAKRDPTRWRSRV